MISYCVAVYRPTYARLLVTDLCMKTVAPHEVLLWLNCDHAGFDAFLEDAQAAGWPVRVLGRTPENLGMDVYLELFRASRYPLLVQIDDDVICVCRGIAERAAQIFHRHRNLRQLVADVWQDEYTTGARPEMSHYRLVDSRDGLYDGPIDGWFSIYHRSILPLLPERFEGGYFPLGGMIKNLLRSRGLRGLLCTRMKVFHVIGPQYSSHFDMLDFEIAKYRRLGRQEIVDWYEEARQALPSPSELEKRVESIRAHLDGWQA